MQEFQASGPNLAIKLIEWDREKVRNLFLSLLPSGSLFEGFSKNDTIKGCLTDAIVEMLFVFLNQHNQIIKQLNWLQADDLLPSWEKLCSLDARNLTIEERRINVAIRMGLTRAITSLEDLTGFIRYLGLDFISVVHLQEYYKDRLYYDHVYDSIYYGTTFLKHGLVWELYAEQEDNNIRLKNVLKKLSIQTARHIFIEIGENLPNIPFWNNKIIIWNGKILTV
jgi:hypothetical protein